MEETYIPISTLNDFIFCPYSIYLHNVYENTDESLYHAIPQTEKNGAIRLQFSVYEINNTKRVLDNLLLKVDEFAKVFDGGDSIMVFDVSDIKLRKYGNAIHRDKDVVFL